MQSTGQTSTQELSFVPMQGSAITYAICRANLANPHRLLTFRDRDHLTHTSRAREAPGREARRGPEPRSAGPVPDREVPRADLWAAPGLRPGELGLQGQRLC